jgi:Flp pilus assembly pilin Flp
MWSGYLRLISGLKTLMKREDGQDLVEYTLILALIGAGAVAVVKSFGIMIATSFANINAQLDALFG